MMDSPEFEPLVKPKPVRGREMRTAVIPKATFETVRALTAKIRGESVEEALKKTDYGEPEIFHEGYIDGKLYLVPDKNLQTMRDIVNFKMRRKHTSAMRPQTTMEEQTQYREFSSKLAVLLKKVDNLTGNTFHERFSSEESEQAIKISVEKFSKPLKAIMEETIPPILDEKIKYKRVKPNKKGKIGIHDPQRFRFVLTGHLKPGKKPLYIIHQKRDIPNILENQIPDFKSHKTDGDCNIYIAGKFFTKDILQEATSVNPAYLDLPPHKINIDASSAIHYENFQNTFHFGQTDIVLEGGFIKNKDTLKCTPVLTMEIHKNMSFDRSENSDIFVEAITDTNIYRGEQQTPFQDENNKKRKHVHYSSEHDEAIIVNEVTARRKKRGLFGKMIILNRFFRNSKFDTEELDINRSPTKSSTKTESVRSIIRKKQYRDKRKKLRVLRGDDFYRKDEELDADSIASSSENKLIKMQPKTNVKRLKKKHKKEDKNQAIVENPILAQMQEFFIS